jgi:hypothetical protein
MVNVFLLIFSLSINKTAKKRDIVRDRALAHSLPKEGHGGVRDEQGVVKHFHFVGFDIYGYTSWSTNTLQAKLQRHAL